MSGTRGTVEQLHVSTAKGVPMTALGRARLRAGHGIEGDRRAGRGGSNAGRQVLIMDAETQAELGIDPSVTRENLTTRGLNLAALSAGMHVRIGDSAVVEITGDCAPCAQMDEAQPGLKGRIAGRRGVLGRVVGDGSVRAGDPIVAEG